MVCEEDGWFRNLIVAGKNLKSGRRVFQPPVISPTRQKLEKGMFRVAGIFPAFLMQHPTKMKGCDEPVMD